MAVILITSEFFGKFSDQAGDMLRNAGHDVRSNPYGHHFLTPSQILPHLEGVEAIICDLEKINREVIYAAKSLRVIARRGVGLDSVDLVAAAERGIQALRTPGSIGKPVAELVMAYILSFSRQLFSLNTDMKKGQWNKRLGSGISGKKLGLLGMGRIAREVAHKAAAFDMELLYCSPSRRHDAEEQLCVRPVSFDELLECSDYLSLHVPLTPETRGLIGSAELSRMKPTAMLINTARGAIVDEAALYEALKSGKLKGAAIDVYDVEPNITSPLQALENVILTPHVGTFTREGFIGMDIEAANNVIDFFKA